MATQTIDASDIALTQRSPSSPSPAVEVRNLSKVYPGEVRAVRGIDFAVATGEVFGLLGPNGAGKSTTIGMLTTTILPSEGCARLAGFDVTREPLQARAVSSVVFQEPVVDRTLSGRANLELHARLWGVGAAAAAQRIVELARLLELDELLARPVATYSGGQRRRLEIARALVSRPRVLFLDEPTVGLDPLVRAELLDAIAALRERERMTVLLTTHYLDEAEQLCERVAVMHAGSIVALDTPAALLAELGEELIELRVPGGTEAAISALAAAGLATEAAFVVGTTLTLPLERGAAGRALEALDRAEIAVGAISTRRPTLDDVYLRLTGEGIA